LGGNVNVAINNHGNIIPDTRKKKQLLLFTRHAVHINCSGKQLRHCV